MTVLRPTEHEAIRNIRWHDIEIIAFDYGLELQSIDWTYILMVKHINFGLGRFARDLVSQFMNDNIRLVVASRLDQSYWYTANLMDELYAKFMMREIEGLQPIPHCTPYDEIIKHHKRLKIERSRSNIQDCVNAYRLAHRKPPKNLTTPKTVLDYE